MSIRGGLFLSVFLVCLFTLGGYPPARAQQANEFDQKYLALVEKSTAMPVDYDFHALRAIYPKTSFFNPYGTFYKREVHELFDAYKSGAPGAGTKLASYLSNNFPLPEVHTRYVSNYNALGKQDLVAFHGWVAKGLMKAMFSTGANGTSAQKAFPVLNVSEEYMIARQYIDGDPSQKLKKEAGRVYDVLTGKEKGTGQIIDIWFDITDIWAKNPASPSNQNAMPIKPE